MFKIDRFCVPIMVLDIANAVGLRYKKLSILVKIKFYTNQMNIKLKWLKLLVFQDCCHIYKMESKIKYVKSLEISWENEI